MPTSRRRPPLPNRTVIEPVLGHWRSAAWSNDYVRVLDATGNVVATYTGLYRKGVTTPCIPTASASVHFTSDSGTSAQGFVVDTVTPC